MARRFGAGNAHTLENRPFKVIRLRCAATSESASFRAPEAFRRDLNLMILAAEDGLHG